VAKHVCARGILLISLGFVSKTLTSALMHVMRFHIKFHQQRVDTYGVPRDWPARGEKPVRKNNNFAGS